MYSKRKLFTTIAITVILTSVLTYTSTMYFFTNVRDVPVLTSTIPLLQKYYYGEVDMNNLDEAATKAAVNSLGDPYTVYMNKEEFNEFNQMLEQEYCGIGVIVTKETEQEPLFVQSAFEGSPAFKSGIKTGDKITKVNDISLIGMDIEEATALIKGEEGSELTITVIDGETDIERNIRLTRQFIDIPVIYTEMLENDIGYISLSSFNEGSGNKFSSELDTLISNGAKSIIFDLRGNSGGYAIEAEIIANALLPKNSVVYSIVSKTEDTETIKTTVEGTDVPLVLLVDENSASASEIVAGAIKENNRGKLVGKTTFGKALVQTVIPNSSGSALKVTIARYFTPSGTDIQKSGIIPDYEVELKSAADEQLQFAIDLLK